MKRASLIISRFLVSMAVALMTTNASAGNDEYQIGVYYFPGWRAHQAGAPSSLPWKSINRFPEREPLLGWYDDGAIDVLSQQVQWMEQHAIDFVVFDWYFVKGQRVVLDHALSAFLQLPKTGGLQFSLLWANHSSMPASHMDWVAMVGYWIESYFPTKNYLKRNGRPVVFVFSADELEKQARSFGSSTKDLLSIANSMAIMAGFAGVEFVAGTGAYLSMINGFAKDAGYGAFSAYNYHQGPLPPRNSPSHSFAELDAGYQDHWRRFAAEGDLPLIVPMTVGWDKRAWGGSKDPLHDFSMSTPDEFEQHLISARSFMNQQAVLTSRFGVICCWNEFGEGSFIEPTKTNGFSYLEKVKKVFGTP